MPRTLLPTVTPQPGTHAGTFWLDQWNFSLFKCNKQYRVRTRGLPCPLVEHTGSVAEHLFPVTWAMHHCGVIIQAFHCELWTCDWEGFRGKLLYQRKIALFSCISVHSVPSVSTWEMIDWGSGLACYSRLLLDSVQKLWKLTCNEHLHQKPLTKAHRQTLCVHDMLWRMSHFNFIDL